MFICNECLEKHYDNIGIFKSYGACEVCDAVSNCNDIPTVALEKKGTRKPPKGYRTADGTYIPFSLREKLK